MIQNLFALPWPNLPIYLDDLRSFRKESVDGVVYEAYEPGIGPFVPMLDTLAKAMWSPDLPYEPTPFEQAFLRDHEGPQWPGNRYWESCRDELPLEGIYPLVSDFRDKICRATVAALLGHVLSRVDRIELDWLYIGYRR
jgi:hypothetical protein